MFGADRQQRSLQTQTIDKAEKVNRGITSGIAKRTSDQESGVSCEGVLWRLPVEANGWCCKVPLMCAVCVTIYALYIHVYIYKCPSQFPRA